MSNFVVGDVLAGKYEIKAILGAGGMGTVYRARQIDLGRDVAIKVPMPAALEVPGFLARFSREAKLVAKLVHDNIVQVYEYQESMDSVYIVMEYVEGQDVKALLGRPPADLTVRDVATILRASCEGLSHAHENGIVHRDIKPHNIMVAQGNRGKWRVKIMDFGIAHMDANSNMTMQQEQLTVTGQAIGTPSYMAPEQIRGVGVTYKSDIYSFGCVIHYCFTRQTPFQGTGFTVAAAHLSDPPPPLRSKVPSMPAELEELVLRCLEKNPDNRPDDASDLGQDLFESLKPLFDVKMLDLWPATDQEIVPGTALNRGTAPLDVTQANDDGGGTMGATLPGDSAPIPSPRLSTTATRPRAQGPEATRTSNTNTAPQVLKEETIPYAPPPVSAEAVPAGDVAPPKKSLMPIAVGGLGLILILGTTAGILVAKKFQEKKESEQIEQPITPIGTNPRPTPAGGEPGGGTQVVVDPTPAPTLETPVATPAKATPTKAATPTPDPVLQRLELLKSRAGNATDLPQRVALWRNIVNDPAYLASKDFQAFGQEVAESIYKNPAMSSIPATRFTMGSPEGIGSAEERPQHNVSLDAYSIGRTEVTATELAIYLNTLPKADAEKIYPNRPAMNVFFDTERNKFLPREKKELHPANGVSWALAEAYTAWLSKETGKLFRLPTEAEWEYAARAGSNNMYPWGQNSPENRNAHFGVTDAIGTVDVTDKSAGKNSLELFHMAGNVAEWCVDWYSSEAYQAGDRQNPTGPTSPPPNVRVPRRSLRGGSYASTQPEELRTTRRDSLEPGRTNPDIGFRLVSVP